jgi:hypothetical protein
LPCGERSTAPEGSWIATEEEEEGFGDESIFFYERVVLALVFNLFFLPVFI